MKQINITAIKIYNKFEAIDIGGLYSIDRFKKKNHGKIIFYWCCEWPHVILINQSNRNDNRSKNILQNRRNRVFAKLPYIIIILQLVSTNNNLYFLYRVLCQIHMRIRDHRVRCHVIQPTQTTIGLHMVEQ